MSEKLGCAIWGAGWVSVEHLKAYAAGEQCQVVAVGSRREQSARSAAAQAGLDPENLRVYTDYDALIADEGVQLLSICTPSDRHVEEGVAAIAAGKHIIMEKPMALELEGLRALRDAARQSSSKAVVSFVLHWNPSLVNTKALVDAGAIGDIFYAEADYWHGVSDWYSGWDWCHTKQGGGSSFLFGGCHAVDAIRWLTGLEIVQVSAQAGGWDDRYEYPATVVGVVKWSNGAVGKIGSSVDCVMPYQFNIDIMGDKGSVRDNKLWSTTMLPEATDWTQIPAVLPDSGDVEHHPFIGEIDHIANAILNDTAPCPDIEDAVKTHEVCLAMDISAANGGEVVDLPLLPD